MDRKITEYSKLLNLESSYPGTYLQRNHIMYPLVCYVNNIICFYISKNYKPIPLFIRRAYQHLLNNSKFDGNTGEVELTQKYKQLVLEFLSIMTEFVLSQDIEPSVKDLLPKELL